MKILLIDGTNLLHRAYFGLRQKMTAPDGTPTNAVFGFLKMLAKLRADESPDAVLVAFDTHAPTFRHALAQSYKEHRGPTEDALVAQFPVMFEVLDAMKIRRAELPGWEADDIIGTAARVFSAAGHETVVVSGDRDMLQLVTDKTRMLFIRTKQGVTETVTYTPQTFEAEYGFAPRRLIDLKALMGDSSDNIKGVRGIGEKNASELIRTFGSLDTVYDNLAEIRESAKKKLADGKDDAYLSYELATISTDAPLDLKPEDAALRQPDAEQLYEVFARLGFTSFIKEMGLTASDNSPPLTVPDGVNASEIGSNIKDFIRSGGGDRRFDVSLAAYLLDPTRRGYELPELARQYLNRDYNEAERDAFLANLYVVLDEKLRADGLDRLFYDIEMPLCRVLADMESAGVLVDRAALEEYGTLLAGLIEEAEEDVFSHAGERFNVNSPKQLGVILFEKLGLPAPKRTKTGYSTSAEVLDELENRHGIIRAIKTYRELTKLKATYADGLLRVVGDDGRIRSRFMMTATATGRLSSTEPNLQNIPVRSERGEKLRTMFVAPPGSVLVDADYSQIELRLLAHIAGDSAMIEAFRSGEDIHAVTAARVFDVPLGDVTPRLRSRAKAVNFGIVYGISAFSLAKDIGVSVPEAKEYIESYLERFSGVRQYMTEIVERAKRDGFVTTLFGRRRYIPELRDSNYNTRSFGERVALNMPIQGTAADIMKSAMVIAYRELKNIAPEAKIILQVHDELIVEAPEVSAETVKRALISAMENAADCLPEPIRVPLKVEAGVGTSWDKCK